MPTPDPPPAALGEAIRDLRDELGVSQEHFGLDSGVHRNYIGGIERAERTQDGAAALAELGILAY